MRELPETRSAVVIGGGYTGMTAARRLALEGWSVTLYEGSGRLGGLATGMPLHGTSIEHTYHHLFNTDEAIIGLADELGVREALEFHDSSVAIYRDGEVHPFNGAADLLKFKPLRPWNRLRVGVVALFVQRSRRWKQLVDKPAYDWMRRWSGRQATEVIWEPLLRGKFHRHFRTISMAWLWSRLNIRTNSRGDSTENEQLGYFNGGFAVFSEALEQSLRDAGVEVRLNSRITAIAPGEAGGILVSEEGTAHHFDRALATVPSYVLAGLLADAPVEYLSLLRSVEYIGAVVAIFTSSQDLGDTYWININEPDAPFLVFLQHTNLVPAARYEGRHVYYIGTYVPHDHEYFQMGDEQLLNGWLDYVSRMFTDFDPTQVETRFVGRYRNAQHVTDTGYADKMPEHRTPISGLYLANFSQLFPVDRGTNYAVRDGERLAAMIDSDWSATPDVA